MAPDVAQVIFLHQSWMEHVSRRRPRHTIRLTRCADASWASHTYGFFRLSVRRQHATREGRACVTPTPSAQDRRAVYDEKV